jgi:hypothetical protein
VARAPGTDRKRHSSSVSWKRDRTQGTAHHSHHLQQAFSTLPIHSRVPRKHLELPDKEHTSAAKRYLTEMNDLTGSAATDMSWSLLDKLAPETRILIYGHVLSFETPVKHAANLQPFLQKLTGAKSNSAVESVEEESEFNWESIDGEDELEVQNTEAEPELSSSTKVRDTKERLCLVDTSILTTSKLVYTDAIAIIYKINIINADALLYNYGIFISLQATDLSLATRIVANLDTMHDRDPTKVDKAFGPVTRRAIFIVTGLPAIFPQLRSSTLCINVNARHLICVAELIRAWPGCSMVCFDGVGSLATSWSSLPNLKFTVHCRATMQRWADQTGDITSTFFTPVDVSANVLYRALQADPECSRARFARSFFDRIHATVLPEDYGAIDEDSHEFWTVIDVCLTAFQRTYAEHMRTSWPEHFQGHREVSSDRRLQTKLSYVQGDLRGIGNTSLRATQGYMTHKLSEYPVKRSRRDMKECLAKTHSTKLMLQAPAAGFSFKTLLAAWYGLEVSLGQDKKKATTCLCAGGTAEEERRKRVNVSKP